MTYEEYKKKREVPEPRSVPLTVFFAGFAVIAATGCGLIVTTMLQSGFSVVNALLALLLSIFAVYSGLCAIDGRAKSTKETLFDIFWIFPF